MASIEDLNIGIINACVMENMFNPELTEIDLALMGKWSNSDYMTKEEFLRLLNTLNLRCIRVENK